jgi:hypothetical protein
MGNEDIKKYANLIPCDAKQVVLIGAGVSVIAARYKSINPEILIELYPNFSRFVEAQKADATPSRKSVVFLLGLEVKEKTLTSMLQQVSEYLSREGILIFDTPNPFYFELIARKIGGVKNMLAPVLDLIVPQATKTKENFNTILEKAGFYLDRKINMEVQAFNSWARQASAFKGNDNHVKQKSYGSALSAKRHLYRITNFRSPQILVQAHVLKPIGGVNDVRINEPLVVLRSFPGVRTKASREEKITAGPSGLNKIFIWHRPVFTVKEDLEKIQKLRRAGYLIITEFDDHHAPWPVIEQEQFLSFAGVHAIQTTNEQLANLFRPHNPEIGVFPNQLNILPDRDLAKPALVPRIFFGALNRRQDWAPILPEINKMLATMEHEYWFDIVYDEAFFNAIETDKKTFTPHCSYDIYKEILGSADVALLPLADTEFNRSKSDLKLVEVAGHGAVPVASPIVYDQDDQHQEFALFAKDGFEFASHLKRLIDDPEFRLRRQVAARQHVKMHRMLGRHARSRYNWLRFLCERRDDLDIALGRRLAKITQI